MATWHPPIPAGRLYSEDALKLGPALAMLIWCYDRINRDGTIEVHLASVTTDIGKPYGTIKDWWKMLRAGGFFCEEIDRGKQGWVVKLKDEWIDWHVMGNNYPTQGGDVSLEDKNNNPDPVEVPVKAASRRRQGGDVSLESSAYKEDQIDHKTGGETRVKRAHPPTLENFHEGVTSWKTLTGKRNITPVIARLIADRVTDIPKWERIITTWLQAGYNPNNVSGMVDWYEHPEKAGKTNGHKPTNERPPLPVLTPAKDKPDPQAAARAIVESRKRNERTT